ncbi:hypothetical protein OIU74_010098 [Salix koriyanagi]|uniref:Uncharacterized protein n=1 Tax=Salix koriyanagi TaxID=2511006 RepID=A0A9Q0QLH0_9ROSI|nr:hypothetical protein OIU74_010098 [Salix koriyanagi]
MQDAEAIPALEAALNDLSLHPIVRHEVRYHQVIVFFFLVILLMVLFFSMLFMLL